MTILQGQAGVGGGQTWQGKCPVNQDEAHISWGKSLKERKKSEKKLL